MAHSLSHKASSRLVTIAVLSAAVGLAGCTRGLDFNRGGSLPTQQRAAAPLNPTPITPVQQGELQPVAPQTGVPGTPGVPVAPQAPSLETPQAPPQVATAQPPANAAPVTREALVGAWTVSTGGASCQIFLALTKWSGGYRAASRGCSAAAISDVQAWDVKGSQVVLVDSSGSSAATLYKSNDSRFDGSTTSGGAISFSR